MYTHIVHRRELPGTFKLVIVVFLMLPGLTFSSPTPDSLITLTSSNLPIIIIDTHGQMILDEPKITADMGVIDNGPGQPNSPSDPFNGYSGKIGIEIRGSSSQQFPKKQYAVETQDSLGEELSVPLLGLPAESDWVLYAVYNDKSLIRDALMFAMGRSLGHYASRARFCEVILNGQYNGVYLLLEKIGRNKNRVNISKLAASDTLGDALTGGYIVKIDKTEGSETAGWYSGLPPYPWASQRIFYQYHYPKRENLSWPQVAYITQFIRDFEVAMYGSGFADTATGYSHWMDVDALVDYVLLNELGKNVDEFRLSCFMYKDRDSKGGKLIMGPLWDNTLSFGNCDYYDASQVEGFQWTYLTTNPSFLHDDIHQVPFWWKKLLNDPGLQVRLQQRWNDLRSDRLSSGRITAIIDSLTALIDEGRQRNFVRWSILGEYVWPNAYIGQTYAEEIDYLKNWIEGRLHWMDQALNTVSVEGEQGNGERPEHFALEQNYPNPFNGSTVIRSSVPSQAATGRESRSRQTAGPDQMSEARHVKIVVYDLLGREVRVLVDEGRAPGRYRDTFDGSGLASGVYIYRMTAGQWTSSRTMVLLR